MATQQEAQDLKRRARRRLVGAIALVLFLVIVPPLVMDLEPKPVTTTLDVEIPERKDSRLLLPPPVPAPQTESTETAKPEPAKEAAAAPVETPAKAVEASPAKPAEAAPAKTTQSETKSVTATPTETGNYVVVMATLSKKDNVKQLQARLKQAGFKSYTETVKSGAGEQTRVRVGPFANKDAADKARAKLQQLGMNPGPVATR